MKLKFYASFIFLFFVCVAHGQYRIWKPVGSYALLSPDKFMHQTIVAATTDSSNIYFVVLMDGTNWFYIIKQNKQGQSKIDSTYLSNTPFYQWNGAISKAVVYKSEIYLYNEGAIPPSADTVE